MLVDPKVSFSRRLAFDFFECSLDSGFAQGFNPDPDDLALLSFRSCRMLGSGARANQVVMEADTVDDGVAWAVHEAWIQNCWFRGGSWIAIQLTDTPRPGLTAYNRIENYRFGIYIDGAEMAVCSL